MSLDVNNNFVLEQGVKYVTPPDIKDLRIRSPDDFVVRLDEIMAPKERLKRLLYSAFNPTTEPTHEAWWIRKFFFGGAAVGFVVGAMFKSPDAHTDYIRQHNASVFDNKYVGNRHFWDTLAYRCAGTGLKYGARCSAITTAVGIIGVGSVTYRNKLYLPDWLIGFTSLGALSRLWLGPTKMAAGAVIWMGLSLFGYGTFRLMEKVTGISISELEYHSHTQWMLKQRANLDFNHLAKEQELIEKITEELRSGS